MASSEMWVCINCQEACDVRLILCSKCNFPKDGAEHSVVQQYTPNTEDCEDQLTLSKGDLITVIEKGEIMWKGKIGKQEGWFPQTCVEDRFSRRHKYRVIKSYLDVQRDHINACQDDIVTAINRKSNGLMWIQLDGNEGWIPEEYLKIAITDTVYVKPQIATKPTNKHQGTNQAALTGALHRPSRFQKCKVLFEYKNDQSGHLEIKEGDIISIFGEENNGWFLGHIGHEKGLVPATYVQVLENQDGDIVKEVHRRMPGWLWVIHNQTEGWYPENFLTPYDVASGPLSDQKICSGYMSYCGDDINIENEFTYERQKQSCEKEMDKNKFDEACNEDYYNQELMPVPPALPDRRIFPTPPTTNQFHDRTKNTYGNDDHPSDKPPVIPKRVKKIQQQKENIKHPMESTYRNQTEKDYDDVHMTKKKTSELMEYEEPATKSRGNGTDEEKLNESYHVYHYIQDKYETYTESLSKVKRQPSEPTVIEATEKPGLPKRPPPTRPPPPNTKALDKTSIRNNDDTAQLKTLYGKRDENEIRLVMVGRTGSGKSATGNTIMSKSDHFESQISGGSVTRQCKRGECIQLGRKIVVVDTPGLFDTQVPEATISKEIIRCVNMSTPGPHVFLLVIQIARFTDEESESFNRLFELFGDEMRNFAIIVFTKLDDLENEQKTIKEYIDSAPKKLKEFLQRCHGRYIAIDNKSSEKKKTAKVSSLLQLVDSIVKKNGGKCYTNSMYKEAEAALQRKIKNLEEEKAQEKKKEIERIQSTFRNQIESIKSANKKLAEEVSSKDTAQRQIRKEKEKAKNEVNKMKDELKRIDKLRNEDIYRMKKQEKEGKEKQAKDLEEKENKHMQILQSVQQQQKDMNIRYQEMEQKKEQQLLKATEDHNKKIEIEVKRIVDQNNLRIDSIMYSLDAKDKQNEKLQEQILKQSELNTKTMQENERELRRQREKFDKRLEEEKEKTNDMHNKQLEEQQKYNDSRDQRQREEYQEIKKQNEQLQDDMKKVRCKQS